MHFRLLEQERIHLIPSELGNNYLFGQVYSDGQIKTRRDRDGLISHPHTHYARQPISDYHRHARGTACEHGITME